MMNEKEWTEFFELINGRKPSAEDLEQAKQAGEFVPEAKASQDHQPAQATMAQTVPSQEPVQPSSASQPAAPAAGQPQAQAFVAQGQAIPQTPAKPKKKFSNLFKKPAGKKAWPLWLNISLTVLAAAVLIGLGALAVSSQKAAYTQEIAGDWELKEAAFYNNGEWDDPFYKNGQSETYTDETSGNTTVDFFLSASNNTIKSYSNATLDDIAKLAKENKVELPEKLLNPSFSRPSQPTITFTASKDSNKLDIRADDNDYKEYYPMYANNEASVFGVLTKLYTYDDYSSDSEEVKDDLDELEAKYYIIDDELKIVYFDDNEPFYMETYTAMSQAKAKQAKETAKQNFITLEDWSNMEVDEKGNIGSGSSSDRSAFQVG